ncbi:uncharacterized protein K460DRAFT_274859 [Cucurbitaria berberidis CBS 394.84]|uniref:Wings apart-like protein C-terminal domain-containing protein n=1 Tax=Cucurbitaria berberidis CBS 394.84 TaxID=1168544 RepID=A0A9P4GTE7_9PLEO|nr:uncharacterized protein K460DRAFT_274859 [Cucurbitaria berberidis CBS 394.84]KAF1850992.1 hypothetical protein K460DRAFT_274859 [Cucurbitaria berberidis CBS 394.84]
MATSMFSNFTSADRRKRLVTYGKPSRLSTTPAPAPASNDDAPSPERPRKHTATSNGTLKRPGGIGTNLKAASSSGGARANTGSPDIYDVPSEDDFVARSIKPARKYPTRDRPPGDVFEVPLSEDDAPAPSRRPVKAVQPSRKLATVKKAVAAVEEPQKPVQLPKSARVPQPPSDDPVAPLVRRRKTPQPVQKAKQDTQNREQEQQPVVVAKPKASSRAVTPALSTSKARKDAKSTLGSALTKASVQTSAMKKLEDPDVYDVPSSDEEERLPTRQPVRRIPAAKSKAPTKSLKASTEAHKSSVESDGSNTSKKRKRKGSISSVTTVKPTIERKREPSVPQRNHKYQKKEDSISPGLDMPHKPDVTAAPEVQTAILTVNKPRRTRLRTVPVLARPAISKGQSSPAALHTMLPTRPLSKPSPIAEVPEVTALEDETMYAIPDPLATPVRSSKMVPPGSVTPRQKALFSSLLGESSSSTRMPGISTLQLADRSPRPLLGALSRSKSDLTCSAQVRKPRLIDTIKRAETSSDDEDEDDDSTSDSDETTAEIFHNGSAIEKPPTTRHSAAILSDGMDVADIAAASQTSQPTSGPGTSAKLTYAKARSYLEEANPEDALLISMDLDDNLGFDSQRKDCMSEDEDDPTNQVQAHHELKRQGQQKAFHWEAEMSIDDISNKTSNGIRRSAMLELCTKMADTTFTNQLLDSSLAHQFFSNMSSNGEVVFDFATTIALIFVFRTNPTYTVLDQIHRTGIITALINLADNDMDIQRIAKDRKTNLSKIAQESVLKFRTLVHESSIWHSEKPDKLSPQLVALKAFDSLIVGLRKSDSREPLVSQAEISRLVDMTSKPYELVKSGTGSTHDTLVLNSILSILESVSVAGQKQPVWSIGILQRLADLLPVFFGHDTVSSTMLAVKLCMNLTNNKPKACQPFSGTTFVRPLVASIIYNFELLNAGIGLEQRTEVLESLILSLGAMINLAELSDSARCNVDDGDQAIGTLVRIFLEGSERASQAKSMEESHSSVAVGYLTVLLGNLCLNSIVGAKIRTQLPDQRLDMLIDKIKEFVQFHERVDRKTRQFDGEEGQETWQNYIARLMLVVEKLEKAEAQ